TPAAVQMSLMVFFIMLGICQLVYGPLSDMFGRKPPIYAGLAIFVIGSVGCGFAPNINVLIGFRALQSLGACAGMVIPRAIVRDLYTGHEATRLMSLLMLVMSVSPILAPLTGSFIIAGFGWRGIFVVLTIAGIVAFVLAATRLRETREIHDRVDSSWTRTFAGYGKLLTDAEFLGLTLVGAFGVSSFFIYLASSSFVIVNHYGLTPLIFSLCFALNAASFFGFSQLTAFLTAKYGLRRVIRMSVSGFAIALSIVAVLFLAGFDSLALMMTFLFIGYGFLGLILPTTAVLSLENHGAIAGTASALMGALQFVVGAAVMAVSGIFANGAPKPMMIGIAISALIAYAIARVTLPAENSRLPAAAPEET
ncbi:MAG: multidrug effflux MFS transporter, partial [Verrucomicrobia bacterium]|nr:multidrug effflux MFS transporter [Verrucomicrobiota bacterium]